MTDEADANALREIFETAERVRNGEPTHDLGDFSQYLDAEETEGADRYADMVNAPLSPRAIEAIAARINSGNHPVRKVVKKRPEPEPDIGDLRDAVEFLRQVFKTWFLDAHAGLTLRAAMEGIADDMQRCLDIADGKVGVETVTPHRRWEDVKAEIRVNRSPSGKMLDAAVEMCRVNGTISDLHRLLIPMFEWAKQDLIMCERQNSRDPDSDGKTRILPHSLVGPVLDIARLLTRNEEEGGDDHA